MNKIKEKLLSILKRTPKEETGVVADMNIKDETVVTDKTSVSNYILLALAIVLALILVIAMIPTSKEQPKIATAEAKFAEAKIKLSKETIDIKDQKINADFEDNVIITVLDGKLKIDSVKLDPDTPSVMLKENCTEKGELASGVSECSVNIYWKPIEQEDESPKIIIKWTDLSSQKPVNNTSFISLYLKTEEAAIEPIPEPEPPVVIPEPEPVEQESKLKSVTDLTPVKDRLECKRRATTAYGLNGNPIGWITPEKVVYSTRCANVLGHLNSKGEVIDNNGNVIGYNQSAMKDLKLKKMISMSIPDNWFDYDNKKEIEKANWQRKLAARAQQRAAAKQASGGDKAGISRLQVEDKGEIYKKYVNSKVPFTIKTDSGQVSSSPKDETYVIRRFKPIPAVVSYPIFTSRGYGQMPAIGIVERNVYGEDGRVVLIPAGSKILGGATGQWPNTYVEYAKVQIEWYRIIRPDGAEFTFDKGEAISGDAQGRLGVPGKGATDYLQQFVQPMITALVPAAINMLNPVSSAFTSKIIMNNDGTTSNIMQGEQRSQELAKQELIKTWNTIAEKFVKDSMENNVPPFEVPAGTRVTIYPTKDIMLKFDESIAKDTTTRLKDAGAGVQDFGKVTLTDNPNSLDNPVSPLAQSLNEGDPFNTQMYQDQQAILMENALEPEPAPAPVADPFNIPLADPNTAAPAAEDVPEELGQTPEGYYILGDSVGCWTEDENYNVIQDPYTDPDIGC